jgi:superfamily II DNA helicase RecQ
VAPAKESKKKRSRAIPGIADVAGIAGGRGAGADDADEALFEELRALRLEIARREGLPAYMIFNDASLREMAAARPADVEELLQVNGVGVKKLEKYGEEFLAVINGAAPATGEIGGRRSDDPSAG